jgi:hypothetical protein
VCRPHGPREGDDREKQHRRTCTLVTPSRCAACVPPPLIPTPHSYRAPLPSCAGRPPHQWTISQRPPGVHPAIGTSGAPSYRMRSRRIPRTVHWARRGARLNPRGAISRRHCRSGAPRTATARRGADPCTIAHRTELGQWAPAAAATRKSLGREFCWGARTRRELVCDRCGCAAPGPCRGRVRCPAAWAPRTPLAAATHPTWW